MKAIIQIKVPEHQIGQEVSVYFKDSMCIKGVCAPLTESDDCVSREAVLNGIKVYTKPTYEHMREWVNALPSVQPKRDKGDKE